MTRNNNNFTFNGEELTILFENLRFALEHLTNDFSDEQTTKLYRKEIKLLNDIYESL